MAYDDRTLKCVDCGADFTFTKEEQEIHEKRGYANEPKRCAVCREARRKQRGPGGGGGGGGYGAGGYGGGAGGDRPRFETTCAACGQKATVPFQPKNNRPVYCDDCFRKQRDSGPR
jgi:CxxC-x17-CxxC domain-containing protein